RTVLTPVLVGADFGGPQPVGHGWGVSLQDQFMDGGTKGCQAFIRPGVGRWHGALRRDDVRGDNHMKSTTTTGRWWVMPISASRARRVLGPVMKPPGLLRVARPDSGRARRASCSRRP